MTSINSNPLDMSFTRMKCRDTACKDQLCSDKNQKRPIYDLNPFLINSSRISSQQGMLYAPCNDSKREQRSPQSHSIDLQQIQLKVQQKVSLSVTSVLANIPQESANFHEKISELFKKEPDGRWSVIDEATRKTIIDTVSAYAHIIDAKDHQPHQDACSHHQGSCSHDHDHGFIAIDLDEAVHGLYASIKYMIAAASGDPKKMIEMIEHDAELLQKKPWDYLALEAKGMDGAAGFGVAVGVSALLIPFACLAIKAGLREARHAISELASLKKVEAAHKDWIDQSNQLLAVTGNNDGIKIDALTQSSAKVLNQQAQKNVTSDFRIGVSSLLSGLSIASKATLDLGAKITYGIQGVLSGSSFFSLTLVGAWSSSAMVIGFLGSTILAPLAGIFAVSLGVSFRQKLNQVRNQMGSDWEIVQKDWQQGLSGTSAIASMKQWIGQQTSIEDTDSSTQNNSKESLTSKLQEYMDAASEAHQERMQFFSQFIKWNRAFLIGSGLYGASAVIKAAVISFSLAGLAIGGVANPIIGGVLLAMGLGGAIVMAVGSWKFFTGHDKQGEYCNDLTKDHPEVNRHFLTSLDILRTTTHSNEPEYIDSQTIGMRTRIACHQWMEKREEALKIFLTEAEKNCHTAPTLFSKGGENKISKRLTDNHTHLNLIAQIKGKQLKSKEIAKWMQEDSAQKPLLKLIESELQGKLEYIQHKIKAHEILIKSHLKDKNQLNDAISKMTLEENQHIQKVIASAVNDYQKDKMEIISLVKNIEKISDLITQEEAQPEETKKTIMKILHTSDEKALAITLKKEWLEESKHILGVLFASQYQGSTAIAKINNF